jgi:hypothetical protein
MVFSVVVNSSHYSTLKYTAVSSPTNCRSNAYFIHILCNDISLFNNLRRSISLDTNTSDFYSGGERFKCPPERDCSA